MNHTDEQVADRVGARRNVLLAGAAEDDLGGGFDGDLDARLEEFARLFVDNITAADFRRERGNTFLSSIASLEKVARAVDAMRIIAAGETQKLCDEPDSDIAAKHGCRNEVELLERLTLADPRTLKKRLRLATKVSVDAGPFAAPPFPALGAAFETGRLSVDAAETIAGALGRAEREAAPALLAGAEQALVASALGEAPETPAPLTATEVSWLAEDWVAVIAPDGAAPDHAHTSRSFRLTPMVDGLVRVTGKLLPEVASQFTRLNDALANPRIRVGYGEFATNPDTEFLRDDEESIAGHDTRTADQKRHDVLADILTAAARAESMPSIGGAAPTLIVTVTAEDLASSDGTGVAWAQGVNAPIGLSSARAVACTGVVQRVVQDARGRIVSIGTPDRVFNAHQRRAILVRDGGCVIPGCSIPGAWCEIHHVDEHRNGGPTHTDNGVLLCWHHHRDLDRNGWAIRMKGGIPEVRPPAWINPDQPWRASTKSPTTRARLLRKLQT